MTAKQLVLVGAMVTGLSPVAAGQSKQPSTSHTTSKNSHAPAADTVKGPSTLDGLYTDEQASRGKDLYFNSCRSCHTPASHTGATFNQWWRGKHLSDLFAFISTRMPKNDPGSLAPEDVADVMAYLLKMNAMPVGPNELPPDVDSLKKYRIEAKPKTTPPPKRKKP